MNTRAPRRNDFDIDDLINRYLSGESCKSLANSFGFSRQVVYRVLRNAGITPRNRSQAMFVRMQQTSPEERQRISHNAHEARRGRKNTPDMLHKVAIAKIKRIGAFENEFINALENSGIETHPQQPFLSYNLDIGCGNVAVEIHTQVASPVSKNFIKKLVECVHSGMNMIYVWISPRHMNVTDACYNKVVSLVQSCRANPPAITQYWVVRSTGEIYATGSFDID